MNFDFFFASMPIKQKILLMYYNTFLQKEPGKEILELKRSNALKGTKLVSKIFDKKIEVKSVSNTNINGRHGDIPIRIYEPFSNPRAAAIVYSHGGGFVQLNLDSHDYVCRRLCEMNNAKVISVDYRLAPENKFPIPLDDCYDAVQYVIENSNELKIDKNKIIVAGDSAGGNLATAVCHQIKAQNLPKLAGQVLIYPCLDARLNHPSVEKFGQGFLLTHATTKWYVKQYSRNEEDIINPLLSPLLAKDFSNLPPAFILTAGFDILQDEAKLYAEKLKEAAVQTDLKHYEGLIHGFFNFPLISDNAMQAYDDVKIAVDRFLEFNT